MSQADERSASTTVEVFIVFTSKLPTVNTVTTRPSVTLDALKPGNS